MDLQKIITDGATAARVEELKSMDVITLGELLLKLEHICTLDEYGYDLRKIKFDFEEMNPTEFRSWRGIYAEIAIGYGESTNHLSEFIRDVKNAIGHIYTGYKGGDFTMGRSTPVWVANYGQSGVEKYKGEEGYFTIGIIDVTVEGDEIVLITKKFED